MVRQDRGRFSLPGEERQVAGTVVADPAARSIKLDVDAHFVDAGPLEMPSHPVVHGDLVDGTSVTLLNCDQLHRDSVLDSTSRATYGCRFYMRGAHVEADERFSLVEFGLSSLADWISQRGFNVHSDFKEDHVVYSAATRAPFQAVAETTRGTLTFYSGSTFQAGPQSAEFGTVAGVRVVPQEAVTLGEVFALYVRPLQDLITIATGEPQDVHPLRVTPMRSVGRGENPSNPHDWVSVTFPRWADAPPSDEVRFSGEMLFSLSDLLSSLSDSLDLWFHLDDQIHEVRTLVTGPSYRSGMFADQRFLYAAHAIETYHRRRIGGTERSKEAHRELIRIIEDAIPPEHRSWTKDRLAWSNELSLLRRIQDLRGLVCPRLESLLACASDWERWVKDTRNFYTHFTRSRRARIAEGKQLVGLTESLLLVIDDLLLRELGLSEFARNELVQRTRRFRLVDQWFGEIDWERPPVG